MERARRWSGPKERERAVLGRADRTQGGSPPGGADDRSGTSAGGARAAVNVLPGSRAPATDPGAPEAKRPGASDDVSGSASALRHHPGRHPRGATAHSEGIGEAGASVRFDDVAKSYPGTGLVIGDLNIDVARGEFLTLLAPPGSGKTTSLMMLAGFETPTRGRILIDERPMQDVPAHRRGIGIAFRDSALFPNMSVAQNLAFPLKVRRMGRRARRKRVAEALAMVELEARARSRPAELTENERRRATIARALVFEPRLVLMDEPLADLGREARLALTDEIKHLNENLGVTIVYATRDDAQALALSDRIAVLGGGAIQQLSTPAELYERPMNAYVASVVGESNLLPATVEAIEGGTVRARLETGALVSAERVLVDAVGDRTTLAVRPESIVIGATRDAGGGEAPPDALPARIEELTYLGDRVRVRLSAAGMDGIVALVPARSAARLVEGEDTTIGWHAADCRALDPAE